MKKTKIRKSIYIPIDSAKRITEYAEKNGLSESLLYTMAVKRFLDNGIVIEFIKSIQNNG